MLAPLFGADFNPHPPHGGRPPTPVYVVIHIPFQSTPSAWRATLMILSVIWTIAISIHTLRMEGDGATASYIPAGFQFQSTPSAWRATINEEVAKMNWKISIHTLRMEGDKSNRIPLRPNSNFNPHPPHGGRPWASPGALIGQDKFQSTPSAWRATDDGGRDPCPAAISIYTLRMEGDCSTAIPARSSLKFQSTPSAWRATVRRCNDESALSHFNPHPPHGGRQQKCTKT